MTEPRTMTHTEIVDTDARMTRIAVIDRMFDAATSWGSWMVSCSNERKGLVNAMNNEGHAIAHKYQVRTDVRGRTS